MDTHRKFVSPIIDELSALEPILHRPELGTTRADFDGPQFIDRVEAEARRNPDFAFTLGGVWQNQMTDEVWARLQAVATYDGWDSDPDEVLTDPDTLEP